MSSTRPPPSPAVLDAAAALRTTPNPLERITDFDLIVQLDDRVVGIPPGVPPGPVTFVYPDPRLKPNEIEPWAKTTYARLRERTKNESLGYFEHNGHMLVRYQERDDLFVSTIVDGTKVRITILGLPGGTTDCGTPERAQQEHAGNLFVLSQIREIYREQPALIAAAKASGEELEHAVLLIMREPGVEPKKKE